jgi:hypothetical protein
LITARAAGTVTTHLTLLSTYQESRHTGIRELGPSQAMLWDSDPDHWALQPRLPNLDKGVTLDKIGVKNTLHARYGGSCL